MSDALSDIRKDDELARLGDLLHRKEQEFLAAPDPAKAAELQALWADYARAGSGYWSSPNRDKAMERVALYAAYLEGGELDSGPLEADQRDTEGTFNLRVGAGFIVNIGEVEAYILRKLRELGGPRPVSFSSFRVQLAVEDVKRLSCAACPDFGYCHGGCNTKNKDEYHRRQERREKGAALLNQQARSGRLSG